MDYYLKLALDIEENKNTNIFPECILCILSEYAPVETIFHCLVSNFLSTHTIYRLLFQALYYLNFDPAELESCIINNGIGLETFIISGYTYPLLTDYTTPILQKLELDNFRYNMCNNIMSGNQHTDYGKYSLLSRYIDMTKSHEFTYIPKSITKKLPHYSYIHTLNIYQVFSIIIMYISTFQKIYPKYRSNTIKINNIMFQTMQSYFTEIIDPRIKKKIEMNIFF